MKKYNELIKEIDLEIIKKKSKEMVVNKLIKNIKETNCGINQIAFHKEWYNE